MGNYCHILLEAPEGCNMFAVPLGHSPWSCKHAAAAVEKCRNVMYVVEESVPFGIASSYWIIYSAP